MPITGEDSIWPIVLEKAYGNLKDEDVRSYNDRRAERLSREEKHVQIMDAREGGRMAPRHRKLIAEFDAKNGDKQRRYLAGIALVTTSALLRAVLSVVYRLTPSACPRKPCRSVEEATLWASNLLKK